MNAVTPLSLAVLTLGATAVVPLTIANAVHRLIHSIPAEILAEIFSLCHPGLRPEYEKDIHFELIGQGHLRRLAQVCSGWKTLVKDTPSLWCTIALYLSNHWEPIPAEMLEKMAGFLRVSLERSRHCLLDVHIYSKGHGGSVIDMVVQHSRRWRYADIYIDEELCVLLKPARHNLPQFTSLLLEGCEPDDMDAFEVAPKLSKVQYRNIPSGGVPALPWAQLRSVVYAEGETINLDCALASMTLCPTGASFGLFTVWFDRGPIDDDFAPVTASIADFALRLANMDRDTPEPSREAFAAIIDALTLPVLEAFRVGGTWPQFWSQPAFHAFASRSSCATTLQQLELENTVITEEELVSVLAELPGLLALSIQDIPPPRRPAADPLLPAGHTLLSDNLLRRLIRTTDPSCLVPKLSEFKITSTLALGDLALIEFIASRVGRANRDDDDLFSLEILVHPNSRSLHPFLEGFFADLDGKTLWWTLGEAPSKD